MLGHEQIIEKLGEKGFYLKNLLMKHYQNQI